MNRNICVGVCLLNVCTHRLTFIYTVSYSALLFRKGSGNSKYLIDSTQLDFILRSYSLMSFVFWGGGERNPT